MTTLIRQDLLLERVAVEIAEESNRVALGTAEDWPDYKKRTGIIEGLRKLDRIINDMTEDSR